MDEPLITVSMPFYGTHQYVRRAVDSVLAQTYKNLKLVVVNDGDPEPPWKLLEDIDDPRLVRFDSGINRGPYFCHEIVRRCSEDLFAVFDSDDTAYPRWLSVLSKNLGGAQACLTRICNGRRWPGPGQPEKYTHRAAHCGLWKVNALESIGGYYGGFPMSYDTFLINCMMLVGRISFVTTSVYKRTYRNDSLTRAPATGMQSQARLLVSTELKRIYNEARLDPHAADFIRVTIENRLTDQDKAFLLARKDRLRSLL